MPTSRVLVADDDPGFAEYLRHLIDETPGFVTVGVAADGLQALKLAGRHLPDVVAMDIDMPGIDGVEAAAMLLERHPAIGVVLFSGTERDDEQFVPKGGDDELVEAIARAARESRRLRLVHL